MSEPVSVPVIPPPAPPCTGILLPPNLAALVKLAAKEEGRYAMHGIHLEITASGYRAVATNGKFLGLVEGPAVGPFEDYPELPGLANAPNGATSGIIPSRAWAEAFKMIPKGAARCKPILDSLACILAVNEARFGATDLERAPTCYARLLEGRFPDWRQVFPKPPPAFSISVRPLQLVALLQVAAAIVDADDSVVTIEFHRAETPLVVRAAHKEQAFIGLLMPMS